MKKLNFSNSFVIIILLIFFSGSLYSQCKVIFCTCCKEERSFIAYRVIDDGIEASFSTGKTGGCSDGAGIDFTPTHSYYVEEVNKNCGDAIPIRVYFTACVCFEEQMQIMLPCCEEVDRGSMNKRQPTEFRLTQNFPNPFNPVTKIDFEVPEASNVKITVYDVTGKIIEEILNTNVPAGYHSVIWNTSGKNISSGIYFYKLESGNFSEEKKMVLIK